MAELSEAVRWLERDYDEELLLMWSGGMFWAVGAPWDRCIIPIFTVKDDGDYGGAWRVSRACPVEVSAHP